MNPDWRNIVAKFDELAPRGSPRRKLLQIFSILLIFEGISVLILFSYVGAVLGVMSLVVGGLLLIILTPEIPADESGSAIRTPGIRLIDWLVRVIGGPHALVVVGMGVIAAVLLYNLSYSPRQSIGDADTLALLFGGMMVVYPLVVRNYRVEASFSLLFIGLVVVFLVMPQFVASFSQNGEESSIGSLYVQYMLAAPFAGILDLIGVPASSSGSSVSITFNDGAIHTLGISAYCAGLYSFSIFLAAFFSFVLVFEQLPKRLLALVLAAGLVVAYLGNLFRMVIIGVVGYYRGIDALLWAHSNVGWIVFLSWSAVFWYVLLNYVSKRTRSDGGPIEVN